MNKMKQVAIMMMVILLTLVLYAAEPSITVLENGNVGIGTEIPGTNLDVVGNTAVSGNLDVAGTVTAGGEATLTGDAEIKSDAVVRGDLTIDTDLAVKHNTIIDETLTVKGTLQVTDDNGTHVTGYLIPKGGIVMWSGNTIPEGWALCDGQDGRPDLRSRFVLGSNESDLNTAGQTGGNQSVILNEANMPSHDHKGVITSSSIGNHGHSNSKIENGGNHSHSATDSGHGHNIQLFTGALFGNKNKVDHGRDKTTNVGTASSETAYAQVSVEENEDHSHNLSITVDGGHDHSITLQRQGNGHSFDITPLYYILAFIVKL